jgi:hypothetical protein
VRGESRSTSGTSRSWSVWAEHPGAADDGIGLVSVAGSLMAGLLVFGEVAHEAASRV